MDKGSGGLTVFFEEPFWVGVFERVSAASTQACGEKRHRYKIAAGFEITAGADEN